jgi:uncharacterized protein YukE
LGDNNNIEVDPDGLAQSVGGWTAIADRLGQITQDLERRLADLGSPWGGDKGGEAFLQQYGPARDQVVTGMNDMTGVAHRIAAGVDSMSTGFRAVDEKAVAIAHNLGNARL